MSKSESEASTDRDRLRYLDAEMNHVIDPKGMWAEGRPSGTGVMVPGALRGLEEMSRRYGRLSFSTVLQPAVRIAENGFRIGQLYAALIAWRRDVLLSSDYGRKTFFKNNKPLGEGAILSQPELAALLKRIQRNGADELYHGQWAKKLVSTVAALGGRMTPEDLKTYRAYWRIPRQIQYRDFSIFGPSGRSYGGLWTLFAMKTLENHDISNSPHYSASVDSLEIMLRITRTLWNEEWIMNPSILDNHRLVSDRLNSGYSRQVWEMVNRRLPTNLPSRKGTHSYHVVVVDPQGNAVTGTNTINSLPWGDGVFVEGVPVTNYIAHLGHATRPGERRLTPTTSHLVFQGKRLKAVTGTFNTSLVEAAFQLLVNVTDYNLNAEDASHFPRFGTFPLDLEGLKQNTDKNWLDPKISKPIVMELRHRGLLVEQGGQVDTGSGGVVTIRPDGMVEAGLLPLDSPDDRPLVF